MESEHPLLRVPETDPTDIYRHRDGLFAVELLITAIAHLDLFTVLAEKSLTTDEICERLEIFSRPTDVMLTLLVAMGLLERDGERLRPSAKSREFLTADSPWYMQPYYNSAADRPLSESMLRVLKTGKPADWGGEADEWATAMANADFADQFTQEMDCRGLYLGPRMAKQMDLSDHSRLLDIGGGSGIYACSIAAVHEHMRATVLKKPPVDAIARARIVERGFTERVSIVTGDMFTDALPADHDVHLYSNVLHDWSEAQARALLEKSHDALPPGGLVAIHDAFVNCEKTGPLHVAEYSVLLMHFTEGKCYSIGEYEDMLEAAGFSDMRHVEVGAARGLMTGRSL